MTEQPAPRPSKGGRYIEDPATGQLTRVERKPKPAPEPEAAPAAKPKGDRK